MSDSSDSEEEVLVFRARARRQVRPRINFELNEAYFIERFRLSEHLVDFLENRLTDSLRYDSQRNSSLSVRQQILVCLRFLADNGFFHLTGDAHGISKATVHRCVKRVVNAINDVIYSEVVIWPLQHRHMELTERYHQMAGKPIYMYVTACIVFFKIYFIYVVSACYTNIFNVFNVHALQCTVSFWK